VSTLEPGYLPRNLLLQWHVTERCNLRCQHCYQEANPSPELDLQNLLVILEEFKSLLLEFRRQMPLLPAQITLTGGEPFVRKDFPEFVETIASQSGLFSFAILTNGTLIDEQRASWLAQMKPKFVQVSLEGAQATHDRIRGNGNFEQTVAAIRWMTRAKIPTYISFTAQKQNYREFLDVARLGRKLKVQRVWSDRAIPAGRNQDELKQQILSPEETKDWLAIMARARREASRDWTSRTEISLNRALQFFVGKGQPYRCSAGTSLLCLLPNGDLVPCRRMPIVVGNVLQNRLAELYNCETFTALRNPHLISAGCKDCLFNRLCAGGLRCLAYAVSGLPLQSDPGCWLAHSD
jgi:radical SAM protein with 4Fe4S-binding SPASM domain